jgi:hypothetical protein
MRPPGRVLSVVITSGILGETEPLARYVFVTRRVLLVVFSVTLLVGAWASTPRRIYDERFHLERADELAQGRPLLDVFTESTLSAVGPVFPLLHSVVQRFSGGDTRPSRLVSLMALGLLTALVASVLRNVGDDIGAVVLLFCSSPLVVSSVLAMTETLALVFAFGAFAPIWTVDRSDTPGLGRLVVSGMLMGLAMLTRQSLAVLVLPLIAALICARGFRLLDLAILSAPAIVALLLLLRLWGALVPPGQEHLVAAGSFSSEHLARALIYCAVMGSLMQPTILWSRPIAWLGAAGLVLNVLGGWWSFPVWMTVFPDGCPWTQLFRLVFWGTATGVACGFFVRLVRAAWVDRNTVAGICLLAVTLISIGCGLVTGHFSSRYVVAAVPFLLLLSRLRTSAAGEAAGTLGAIVGFCMGLLSLKAYGLW